jgi:hypothetical protein
MRWSAHLQRYLKKKAKTGLSKISSAAAFLRFQQMHFGCCNRSHNLSQNQLYILLSPSREERIPFLHGRIVVGATGIDDAFSVPLLHDFQMLKPISAVRLVRQPVERSKTPTLVVLHDELCLAVSGAALDDSSVTITQNFIFKDESCASIN